MPTVFFGHGSPMNALGGPHAEVWRQIGRSLPRPRAVLMVSAHWYVEGIGVTAMERPPTIHDFYGFPPELDAVRYPAPGAPWLARRVAELIAGVQENHEWGLDHGTWSVLVHGFPQADVPVVQLSLDIMRPPADHLALARSLKPLRDEGVLVAGSGNIVHNLRLARWGKGAPAYDWAVRFEARVRDLIIAGDDAALAAYESLGEDARLSVPTPEHYLPLLYVLAQRDASEPASCFNEGIDLGSISMLGVKIG
ncbi:MAG: 4,5-DOPA dioxygenase extradiol [Alphaproteobacteria bacterium]